MVDIDFGEIVEFHERLDGGEDIISTVYANGRESTVKSEIKMTEACSTKDDVLKELLTAAGLVDQYGEVTVVIKRSKYNKPYLVTRQWRVGYEKVQ